MLNILSVLVVVGEQNIAAESCMVQKMQYLTNRTGAVWCKTAIFEKQDDKSFKNIN